MVGPMPGLAQRPLGLDVSSYQGSGDTPKTNINWTNVHSAGISFAWTKAAEGTFYTDADFVYNETHAKSAGVLIGAYYFAHPEDDLGTAGADTEVAFFWNVAKNYIVTNGGAYLMPMLDYETSPNSNTNHPNYYTKATSSAWVNEWCNQIVKYGLTNGVTVVPVIYTYTSFSSTWLDTSVTNWPLWMASYPGGNVNTQSGAPAATAPWASSAWTFWQYSSTNLVNGVTGEVDADTFNGSSNTLAAQFLIGSSPVPYFTFQSVNSRVVDTGASLSFSATASGSNTLSYQWYLNGAKIAGATNTTYHIASAVTNNSGTYVLTVTNISGSASTSPLSLLVFPPQAVAFSDNFDSNTAANYTVNKSSSDNAVAFNYDYSALGISPAPNTTNGTTRGVQLKANLTLGVVAAISISPIGQSFVGDYRLHFDGWVNVNGPLPGGGASSTEFLSAGVGTAGNRTEWTGSGSTADGYYFTADGDGGVSATSTTSGDYSGYIGTTFETASTGIYAAGSLDNLAAYYVTLYPAGQAPPALQQANYSQQTGSLATGTLGLSWHDFLVARRGSTVTWAVDGVLFATISNATYTASNVFVGFWDPFASLTDNTNLSFGLVDNLRVEVPATLPVITLNPQSQTVIYGTNVTFTSMATGLPLPACQWSFKGTNIPGATSSNYSIASVTVTNEGNYAVTVSNIAGSVVSASATLALLPPHAAQFGGINVQSASNSVQLSFTGDPNWPYTLQTSADLITWNNLTNLTSTNGNFSFNAGSFTNAQEFFRLVVSY